MRPLLFVFAPLLLDLSTPFASAQASRGDPDSPNYLGQLRPQGPSPRPQGQQGQGRGRAAIPKPAKPTPTPEPRAILAVDDAINDIAVNGLYVAVATGAATLVSVGPGNVQVWSLISSPPHKESTVPGHLSFVVQNVAFSPKTDLLAVGDESGGLVLWDWRLRANRAAVDVDWREGVAPRNERDRTGAVDKLTFTPDGTAVAFLPSIAGRVRVHDAADGRELRYWKTRNGYEVLALAFDGEHPLALVGIESNPVVQQAHPFDPHIADRMHDLVVWDVDEGSPRSTIKLDAPIGQFAFSSDGQRLAYFSPRDPQEERKKPNVVTIQDAVRGQARFTYLLRSEPSDLAFSAAGDRLAVSVDDRVILLDTTSARPITELRAPGRTLGRLAFGDEDSLLAVASDREVILWDVSNIHAGPEPFVEDVGPPDPRKLDGPPPM